MNTDLAGLIRLQQLESSAEEARRKIADYPNRIQALDQRLEAARRVVAEVRQRLTDNQNRRRAEEKDVATVQSRLAKYKDQLLEVKTNREYQAMLHEIEAAQTEIRGREDRILETMIEGDDLGARMKGAESDLKSVEKEVAAERQDLDREVTRMNAELERATAARAGVAKEISPGTLAVFEFVARGRKGVGVAEARDGLCSICHVRLRPQVFNEVRRNDTIIQCSSCQRILYFVQDGAAAPTNSEATLEP
jgi:predicted  nucleic acid-binding Zn-ribbon protein